jgi:hypothetical protein
MSRLKPPALALVVLALAASARANEPTIKFPNFYAAWVFQVTCGGGHEYFHCNLDGTCLRGLVTPVSQRFFGVLLAPDRKTVLEHRYCRIDNAGSPNVCYNLDTGAFYVRDKPSPGGDLKHDLPDSTGHAQGLVEQTQRCAKGEPPSTPKPIEPPSKRPPIDKIPD